MSHHYSTEDFGVTRHDCVLSNGLKIVFIEKAFAPIYAKVFIRAGSVFDPLERSGLAHFTEHIIASGSRTHSKEQFSDIMESIGGYWNAATTEEYMSVQCEVSLVEHLANMRDYVTHALTEVHITPESLEKEKNIIISEIERANSDPEYHAYLHTNAVFANGTLWGRPTLGTIESVSSITIEDVQQFFATYCTVENMVLVVSGGCSMTDIEKTFSAIPFLHGALHTLPADPLPLAPNVPTLFEQDIPQTNIMFGFLGPIQQTREDNLIHFALRFAHDGITSRFFKKIRNQKSLAYDVSFRSLSYVHLQYVGTAVGVPTNKVDAAIEAIRECYQELLIEGISQHDIDTKVDTMWFSAKRSMQRSSDWVGAVGYDALYPDAAPLYGPFPDIYNYRRTYTAAEIHDVLKRYITLDAAYLSLNGKTL